MYHRDKVLRSLKEFLPLIVVVVASFLYSFELSHLILLKYDAFNLDFTTTGIETHSMWLIAHGGLGMYYATNFNTVAFPGGDPFMYLLSAVSYFSPSIPIYFVLGTFALGFSSIPLYFFALKVVKSKFIASTLSILWLLYYAVANENLSGDIYMMFFPLFFFLSCYFIEVSKYKIAFVTVLLASSINLLLNIVMIIFLILQISSIIKVEGALNKRNIFTIVFFKKNFFLFVNLIVISGMAGIVFILSLYNGDIQNISGAQNMGIFSILLTDINLKLTFFLFLLAPLAFIPIGDNRTLLLLLPIFGFIFYSINQGTYVSFGHQYTIIPAPILFYGAARMLKFSNEIKPIDNFRGQKKFKFQTVNNSYAGSVANRVMIMIICCSIVMSVVYFPLSPVNKDINGGLFSGNQEINSLTRVTPSTEFLWKEIALIPSNASVFTQNNIIQLSNREYYQIPEIPSLGFSPKFVLIDSCVNYFSSYAPYIPLINSGLGNHSYGLLAEGYGSILVENSYSGNVILFHPYYNIFTGANLSVYNGTRIGSVIVGTNNSYAMWYGPGITIMPGTYMVSFALSSNISNRNNTPLIDIEVAQNGGAQVIVEKCIYTSSFKSSNNVTLFKLGFTTNQIIQNVQFRGMSMTGVAKLTLFNITICQIYS